MAVDYHKYMASRDWALRREAVKERSAGICERCEGLPLRDVHHLTYEHVGREPLEDLQGLCGPCHAFLSAKAKIDPVDVQSWAFSLGFGYEEHERLWEGQWQSERNAWCERYGADWEEWFLVFCIQHPAITNLSMEAFQ